MPNDTLTAVEQEAVNFLLDQPTGSVGHDLGRRLCDALAKQARPELVNERLVEERDRLRERNRLMGDVIDYACGHIENASDAMDFLDDYRLDRWADDPAFVRYREAQRAALHPRHRYDDGEG